MYNHAITYLYDIYYSPHSKELSSFKKIVSKSKTPVFRKSDLDANGFNGNNPDGYYYVEYYFTGRENVKTNLIFKKWFSIKIIIHIYLGII